MPTFNDYERGPLVIDDDERILLANYQKGELAEVMKDFIQVYVKANMFYKESRSLKKKRKTERKLMKSFVISKRDAGTRVDRFIDKTFENLPKSLMYKEIRKRILRLIKALYK